MSRSLLQGRKRAGVEQAQKTLANVDELTIAHPWLDGRFRRVPSLSDHVRIWTFLAGHTAAGHVEAVARDWGCLPPSAQRGGLEAILQTHLFAGYPRTINALAAIGEAGALANVSAEEDANGDPTAWQQRGEALCRKIYGRSYSKLRDNMKLLHPDIDRWMLEIGYGRILSRRGMHARERELCVIAVLAGQGVFPQLRAHLRGAMNVGATAQECTAIIEQTGAIWGDEAQQQARSVWASIHQAP